MLVQVMVPNSHKKEFFFLNSFLAITQTQAYMDLQKKKKKYSYYFILFNEE
jgi:hypothetical protein